MTNIIKRFTLISFLIVILIIKGFSQSEVVNFLQGGIDDGKKLFEAYLKPYGNVLGADLNGGWMNTASTHKFPGFDITFTVSNAFVPKSDQSFDLNSLGLSELTLADSTNSIAQTIAGKNNYGPELLLIKSNPYGFGLDTLARFKSPKGTGMNFFPLPMIKASFGLPFGIELMGRYMPPLKRKDLKLALWGFGIKYDILQYVPIIEHVPFLNASILGAYTQVTSVSDIDFQPSVYNLSGNNYENQELELISKGWVGRFQVSLNFPIICLYGGIGYSATSTDINLKGDYPLVQLNEITGEPEITSVTDPIEIGIDNYSGVQYIGGLRLKFALLTIHADYTFSDYPVISTGLGISFR